MSALFALSEALRFLIISPALLNMRSDPVDVAGTHTNLYTRIIILKLNKCYLGFFLCLKQIGTVTFQYYRRSSFSSEFFKLKGTIASALFVFGSSLIFFLTN